LIKNLSKNDIEFKVGFGISIFLILGRFLTYFGPILEHFWTQNRFKIGSKAVLEAFPTPKWPPKAVWTPLGTVLGAFWEHF